MIANSSSRFFVVGAIIALFCVLFFLNYHQSFADQDTQQKDIDRLLRENVSMGQVEKFVSNDIHTIKLEKHDGVFIGNIDISGIYNNNESWDHLKDEKGHITELAGPENRRIIKSLMSWTARHHPSEKSSKQDQEIIGKIVKSLNETKGVLQKDGSVVSPDMPLFKDAFIKFLNDEYGIKASFNDGLAH